jgi:sodium-dependent phosphate cotransporter
VRLLSVIALLFIFLVGVNGLGDGFKLLGEGVLDSFFAATENPFMGLMVGVLATTLMQSSSVTTSLIVGFAREPSREIPQVGADIRTASVLRVTCGICRPEQTVPMSLGETYAS